MPLRSAPGIGVIGAGSIANDRHLPQYIAAGYRVVGCADTRPDVAARTQARWGLAYAESDHRRLLERPEVAVVLICTPPDDRVQIVRDAATAGKHIVLEKPLAHSYAAAVTMVRAADEAGVTLAVNQNRRWMPVHHATRVLLDAQAIGQPFFAVCSWYERERHFVLIEFGVHHLDLLVYWLGEPQSVYASTSRSPVQRFGPNMVTLVTLHYAGGLRAQLCLNDEAFGRRRGGYWDQEEYVIEGTDGLIQKVDDRHIRLRSAQTGRAWVQRKFPPIASFAASMGDVLDAIQQRRESSCSGRRNLATMRTVFAACRSADEQRVVALEEIAQEEEA
jgi:predicted dehydrogenase